MSLEIVQRSILDLDVDMIVNPANSDLVHAGGLAAVIAREAGRLLNVECQHLVETQGPVAVGSAVTTASGDLPFAGVIHAVGPRFSDHTPDEADRLLVSAHAAVIDEVTRLRSPSVAFPAISCGIFGFPVERAAPIALAAVADAAAHGTRVVFALPDADVFVAFTQAAVDLGLVA